MEREGEGVPGIWPKGRMEIRAKFSRKEKSEKTLRSLQDIVSRACRDYERTSDLFDKPARATGGGSRSMFQGVCDRIKTITDNEARGVKPCADDEEWIGGADLEIQYENGCPGFM